MALSHRQEQFVREYLVDLNATQAAIRCGVDLINEPVGAYVYFLIGSSGRIYYVGKGTRRRMFQHMKDVAAGRISGLKKYCGLIEALDRGEAITPLAICDCLTDIQALQTERSFIHRIGYDNLLNASHSRSTLEVEFERIKRMERDAMPFDRWCSVSPRSELEIGIARQFHAQLKRIKNEVVWRLALSGYPLELLK